MSRVTIIGHPIIQERLGHPAFHSTTRAVVLWFAFAVAENKAGISNPLSLLSSVLASLIHHSSRRSAARDASALQGIETIGSYSTSCNACRCRWRWLCPPRIRRWAAALTPPSLSSFLFRRQSVLLFLSLVKLRGLRAVWRPRTLTKFSDRPRSFGLR
jgi:hypothetical protein